MKEWKRLIPHPRYANYGGRKRRCDTAPCPTPKDWMDRAFMQHDYDLKNAKDQIDRRYADFALALKLRKGNPKELSVWGRIYRRFSMGIFRG